MFSRRRSLLVSGPLGFTSRTGDWWETETGLDETVDQFPHRAELARVFPEYRVIDQLTMTSMSVVYLAEEIGMADRRVALKILHPNLARDDAFRHRFEREPRTAAQLGHPNVIPILRTEERDGICMLAMPYIEGRDLATLIRSSGPLELAQAVDIIGQVAAALDAARERGLVHRDVKPSNILLDQHAWRTWHAFLCDFGIAKDVTGTAVTSTNQVLGTAPYMAPEQFTGREVDHRTDQYALGCVAYECLTGEQPYRRSDGAAVAFAHVHDKVPAVSDRRTGLPRAIDAVVATAMAKNPRDRYPSTAEFAAALREASLQTGSAVTPRTDGPTERFTIRRAAWWRRRREVVAAAVIVVLALAGAAVWSALSSPTDDKVSPALLERVPDALRGGCGPTDVVVSGARRTLGCRDGSGQLVTVGFFDTPAEATAAYDATVRQSGVGAGRGDCERAVGAEHQYPATGPVRGRMLCYQQGSSAVLAWRDDAMRTVSRAESPELDGAQLIGSWHAWVGVAEFPTSVEQRVMDSTDQNDCVRAPVGSFDDFPAAVAGVECSQPATGVLSVSVYRFAGLAQLRRSYQGHVAAAGAPGGTDCTDKPRGFLGAGTHSMYGMDMGGLLCHKNARGEFVLESSFEPLLVHARAVGNDLDQLLAWWEEFGPTRAQLSKAVAELAEPAFPTAGERRLLAHIPARSRVNCLRPPPSTVKDLVDDSAVIALMCGPTRGAERVYYFQFPDLASMRRDYGEASSKPSACTANPRGFRGEGTYRRGGSTGSLYCSTDDDGDWVLQWTAENLNIEVVAFKAESPSVVIDWWRKDAGPR